MPDCDSIDPLVTQYVDGEIDVAERLAVDEHLRRCPPCQARILTEQAVRGLLHAKKAALCRDRASARLRATCVAFRADAPPTSRWGRLTPLVLAASLVLVVGAAFLYQFTDRSSRLLAAELTADHVKCFGANALLGTHQERGAVEQSMASQFGWMMHLPETERAGLELVGARPCLYAEGRVAHIMYRHNGRPVSVFMLPKKTRPEEVVEVLGHEAAIWSSGGRTFVLISREPRAEVARIASFVQTSLR